MNSNNREKSIKKSVLGEHMSGLSAMQKTKTDSAVLAFDPLVLYLITAEKFEKMTANASLLAESDLSVIRFFSYLHLVVSIAKTYQRQNTDLLTLIEEGNIGLLEAIERFHDESYSCRFPVYASWWIRQSIIKCLGEHKSPPRLVMASSVITKEVLPELKRENISKTDIELLFVFILRELVQKIFMQFVLSKKEVMLTMGVNERCPLTVHETSIILDFVHTCIQQILDEKVIKSCEWCEFSTGKLYA